MKKIYADSNRGGGSILFRFREKQPTLKFIGLMDIHSTNKATIKVWWADETGKKQTTTVQSKGYGRNSVESIKFEGIINVSSFRVTFHRRGAITNIGFCYSNQCPSPQALRPGLGQHSSSVHRNNIPSTDAMYLFNQAVLPKIEAEAIYKITEALREKARRNANSFCLAETETSVDVETAVAASPHEICKA